MAIKYIEPVQLKKDVLSEVTHIEIWEEFIELDTLKIPYPKEGDLLIIIFPVGAGSPIYLEAGSDLSPDSKKGNLLFTLEPNRFKLIQPTSSRFKGDDGYVTITCSENVRGNILAVLLD